VSASRGLGLGLVLLACGCHNFTVVNGGKVAAPHPASGYDERLHSAIIGDFVMIDQPVKLDALCPHGWASIDRQVTFFDGVLNMVGGGVYQADSLTVHCAHGAASPAPAPGVVPPPTPSGTPTQPPPSQPPPDPGTTPPISL
jgi:hypothetical protein